MDFILVFLVIGFLRRLIMHLFILSHWIFRHYCLHIHPFLLRVVCIVRITSPELPPMAVQYRCHMSPSVSHDQYTVLPLV